jgi:thiol:disulfide interchange protein
LAEMVFRAARLDDVSPWGGWSPPKCDTFVAMQKIIHSCLWAFVIGIALFFSPVSAQIQPSLSPAPSEDEDPVAVTLAWSAEALPPAGNAALAVVLDIRPGYHVMADKDQLREVQDFTPFPTKAQIIEASAGVLAESPYYPKALPFKVDFVDQPIMSFEGRTVIYLPVRLNIGPPNSSVSVKVKVEYQACAPTTCLMPQRLLLDAEQTIAVPGQTVAAADPILFKEFDVRRAAGRAGADVSFNLFGFGFSLDLTAPLAGAMILLLAALGGFLLNFTPCVLPLIPIKIISMSNAAADRRRCLALGLSTFAGVLVFWVALGGIVSMVSGFTSTNQLFQYPVFSISVGLVIAVMAVGMFGVYSMRLPGVVYALNPKQETLGGALGIGVLTAVLSTPCTAPFMGTAAAWAAGQPPAVTIATFAAIGAGMGLPYALLAAFPQLVGRLPKTGPANVLLKQAMAILMLAAAAYFVGIGFGALSSPLTDPTGRFYWWPVMILCAAAGAWTGLRAFKLSTRKGAKAFWAALGVAVAVVCLYGAVRLTDAGPVAWVSYTPERLARAFREQKTVVMVFTAEWCLNCKALEQGVWQSAELAELVAGPTVAPMKVDLTGSNPEGRKKLQEAGSLTIPLLVVYQADGRLVFKSDFYTAEQVEGAIRMSLVESRPKT